MRKMKEILLFAGTIEGRRLSERLAEAGIAHTLCVATEYGELVLKEHPLVRIRRGRMERAEMERLLREGEFAAVVDATHPYAQIVTENVRAAAQETDIPYLRLKRKEGKDGEGAEQIAFFESGRACAEALRETKGNILLTTGSKELGVYCDTPGLRERLYVRILPAQESFALCREHGIGGKQILAMQGPFTQEMNEATIRQYRIRYLVTKESGAAGGYGEKLKAAARTGISVYAVGRPAQDTGSSFAQVCQRLEEICRRPIRKSGEMEIVLAGAGMGDTDSLTREAYRAIEEADVLLGAQRLLERCQAKAEKKPYYRAEEIVPYLKTLQEERVLEDIKAVALFSGDSGFYSGCQKLYGALMEQIRAGALQASVRILPGVSSLAYFCARIGESYQDAAVYSMHGKKLSNLAGRIRRREKTFLLTSGAADIRTLGHALQEAGMDGCRVLAGCQLSYPDERIMELTPAECLAVSEEGLYICCVRNPYARPASLTHGKPDRAFVRDKIPMTKEEVREVSICKLRLHENAVLYDIGSGTGSIAVEAAGLSDGIRVFAFERKAEAVGLIERNRKKFGADNLSVIEGEAPENFAGLPVPTHAFIGGSSGRLKDILDALSSLNPAMRIVLNAVSMETICEIREILSRYPLCQEEVVQIQASRAKAAAGYHMMTAENPVWICAFTFGVDREGGETE